MAGVGCHAGEQGPGVSRPQGAQMLLLPHMLRPWNAQSALSAHSVLVGLPFHLPAQWHDILVLFSECKLALLPACLAESFEFHCWDKFISSYYLACKQLF